MELTLMMVAALLLLGAAIHLAVCRNQLHALAPIPGEARLWFRPFLFVPFVPLVALIAYAIAPSTEEIRYGLGAGVVALGIWLAVLFAEQRHLYAELASARERRVLLRYTLAMAASAEAAVACLLYGPITNTLSNPINWAGLIFGTFTMNLIVASLHHRSVIQQAEGNNQTDSETE